MPDWKASTSSSPCPSSRISWLERIQSGHKASEVLREVGTRRVDVTPTGGEDPEALSGSCTVHICFYGLL